MARRARRRCCCYNYNDMYGYGYGYGYGYRYKGCYYHNDYKNTKTKATTKQSVLVTIISFQY